MHHLIAAAAILLFAQAQPARLAWVPNPRTANGSWVSDPGKHLRPATVAAMDSVISALERETTTEIAVVVIDSLDRLEPADAAQLLHRRWGVGKSARDNGLVFLWSPALRRTHVSVGYGLEGVLIDSRVGRILDQHVIPAFRRNDFDAGMLAGVRALADAAREETFTGPARSQALRAGRGEVKSGPSGDVVAGTVVGGLGLLVAGGVLALRWRRRRPRRCPRGHGRMRLIDDRSDHRYLSEVENLEEKLDSVDYDVWLCDACDERLVLPYAKWFSGFSPCPKCKRRTCQSATRTLRRATTASTGLREITRTCKNCGFSDRREEIIAQVAESSSSSGGGSFSSGGGGSSFGGGFSGGGGAGRSY